MTTSMASRYLTLPPAIFENPYTATLLPVAVGTIIGFSVQPKRTRSTYAEIKQPPGNPPAWAFGPVWTLLYGLMGYASYRAWTIGTSSINPSIASLARQGATLYTIQLGLNFIWMPLFFGAGRVVEATADIVTLTGVVTYLTYTWSKFDMTSAYCLMPYVAWLSYASYLTFGVGSLNGWTLDKKGKRS